MRKNTTVLISGASIAGPALAYWLGRYGFSPTVVEISPALRTGGNPVDFRGETHFSVLERMGVLTDLRRYETGGAAMRFVDAAGRKRMEMPVEFAGGDLEVPRFDLARVLYEHSRDTTEYVFGDSVTRLTDTGLGVEVEFTSGARRVFDLVIGADGVHSAVRRLTFGDESRYVRHLGYYVATWEMPNDLGIGPGSLIYNVPGRAASIGGNHRDPRVAGAFVMFRSGPLDYDRHDLDQQRRILTDRFAGLTWHVPAMLDALDGGSRQRVSIAGPPGPRSGASAQARGGQSRQRVSIAGPPGPRSGASAQASGGAADFYFDAICRVDITPWSRGRVALLGDAAAGATIGGMGTGTAIVAAYVLAGELARAGTDHTVAFGRYEDLLRDYAKRCQSGGDTTGRFMAPRSEVGRRLRDGLLNRRLLMNLMLKVANDRTNNITLPDYPALVAAH